ncbi:MAG TPA: LysR family transcriptional regulator [Acidimicrobiia bacterium]|nr:LysR family transcriptional regulator [Acidimicrobiia bacterium]
MELRHLDTLVAIAETGSFTGAAEALHTVQSNVSEQVRQLEADLGVPLLVRGRRGAVPTEFGQRVLERARHIRQELVSLRQDLSMLQGLEVGHASVGVVGTISRWLVPRLVAETRPRAPGVSIRVTEGASERLAADVADRLLAQAVVTEPVADPRLVVEHLLVEDLVALVPIDLALAVEAPIPLAALAGHPMILPPASNPLRAEVELAAAASGTVLRIPVEVEGIRLIADLVEAGVGVSVLPETAVPPDHPRLRTVAISDVPPRRLALVTARNVQLSLADQALRDTLVRIMRSG